MITASNPTFVEDSLAAHLCPGCGRPLSLRQLIDSGITLCACGERFVENEQQALSYVDEIPVDEYLGG